jgi:hypothetical protein
MYNPKVFENKPLRRIIGPERKAITGGRKKSQSEEFDYLHSTLHIAQYTAYSWVVKSRMMDLKCKKHAKDR